MIYFALVTIFFTSNIFAQECYLSIDENGTQFIDCRIGAVPPNYKRICPAVGGEKDASVYKVEIADKDGVVLKPWTKDVVLEAGEQVVCAIDSGKVTAKAVSIKAKEDTEKAKKDKDKSDWEAACANPKVGIETLICKERGY